MGCASSAALPFLTGRRARAVTESASQNGKPSCELNNKLNGDSINGVKDVNESFVTEKMKEAIDSPAVQGVVEGVVGAKDEIINQIQGAGETVVNKVTTVVEGVEGTIESAISQISNKAEDIEEKVKSEVKSVSDKISSAAGSTTEEAKENEDEIDELLAALPDENEIVVQSKVTAEELIEAAKEEVTQDEMKN